MRNIDPAQRGKILNDFNDLVQGKDFKGRDLRQEMMKVPGMDQALEDIAKGGMKEQGARYAIERLAEKIRTEGAESIRHVEDWTSGVPKPENTGARTDRLPKQGGDAIGSQGEIIQYKSYSNINDVVTELAGTGERGQIIKDITRYADRGWRDGTGQPLNGRIEVSVDSRQLAGGASDANVRKLNQLARKLTQEARDAGLGNGLPPGQDIQIRIKIE